jgi:hypothetical protein
LIVAISAVGHAFTVGTFGIVAAAYTTRVHDERPVGNSTACKAAPVAAAHIAYIVNAWTIRLAEAVEAR